METNKEQPTCVGLHNIQQFMILQLIIIMFCAIYYEIKNIPEGVRDCTFEVTEEVLK